MALVPTLLRGNAYRGALLACRLSLIFAAVFKLSTGFGFPKFHMHSRLPRENESFYVTISGA